MLTEIEGKKSEILEDFGSYVLMQQLGIEV
jgi:hypothetical protein